MEKTHGHAPQTCRLHVMTFAQPHGRTLIVVITGILKNKGKVPQAELERARRYRADWLERFGG